MFGGFVFGVVAVILVTAACGYAVLAPASPANADASIQLALRCLSPPDPMVHSLGPLYVDLLAALICKTGISGDDKQPSDAAQCSDDFRDHAIGEIFLFGVAAHVLERQHGDR